MQDDEFPPIKTECIRGRISPCQVDDSVNSDLLMQCKIQGVDYVACELMNENEVYINSNVIMMQTTVCFMLHCVKVIDIDYLCAPSGQRICVSNHQSAHQAEGRWQLDAAPQ